MKYITEQEVIDNVDLGKLIEQLDDAYKNIDKYVNPPRTFAKTRDGGDYLVAAATNLTTDRYMVRGSSYSPWRTPAIMGHMMLKNYDTGELLAVFEGNNIINFRTGAKSAVAAKYLAREDSKILGLVGLGGSARIHAESITKTRDIDRILGYSRNKENAQETMNYIQEKTGIEVEFTTLDEIRLDSDILILSTWSTENPIYHLEEFKSGQLLMTTAHYEEVTKDIVTKYRTFVERLEVAKSEKGPVKLALEAGVEESQVEGELHDLVVGNIEGRKSDEEIIFFQSLGSSHEDLVVMENVYENLV